MVENSKEIVEQIRKSVDKNQNEKIDPSELIDALEHTRKIKDKQKRWACRKAILKESFSQGSLMTVAVVVGMAIWSLLMLVL